jgi:cytochrome c-type biogenesis protein CcmH/NrfF
MSAARDIKKKVVKVEAVDTACGKVPHMTVDQLVERFHIESRELHCPACGRIHLTEEDAQNAEAMLFSQTERFQQIKAEAEGDKDEK